MTSTRKPKPLDKGAPPEHKPSRKVALAEVMRSLQDLVSNELSVEPAPQSGDTAMSKKRRRSDQSQLAARADDPPPAVNAFEEVESITLEDLPESAAEAPAAPKPDIPKAFAPTGGLQQELPYLDTLTPPPPESAPEPAALALLRDIPASAPETTPTPAEENLDDIPVLEEAVDLSEEIDAATTGHGAQSPPATMFPPGAAARRLAIQVAARLNVELRKSGQPGLNSAVITQLAKMLEEALAKDAANMENATAMDGGSAGREAVPTGTNAGAVFRPPSEKH